MAVRTGVHGFKLAEKFRAFALQLFRSLAQLIIAVDLPLIIQIITILYYDYLNNIQLQFFFYYSYYQVTFI